MTPTENRGGLGPILLIVGRLMLAGIFLFAAYAKLKPQAAMPWSGASVRTSLSMFAMQVDSYQLLPPQLVSPAAHFLPLFELFLGLWLLSGVWLRYSSLATTLLLGVFLALMVRTYRMGLEINCGCFGPGERLGPKTLLRDGSLLAFGLAVTIGAFLLHRSRRRGGGAAMSAQTAVVSTPQRAD
ncbi:MAG: MauE/DoxX family redox-associated membrane protein [Candidatus Acidiferrales bacterium]